MTRTATKSSTRTATDELDPLFVIFEQHLYNFQDQDSDRKTFIVNVVLEYLNYLRKLSITVPQSLEPAIIDELGGQVNTMLVKKIYGCLSIQDYQKKQATSTRRRVRDRYSKLNRNTKSA